MEARFRDLIERARKPPAPYEYEAHERHGTRVTARELLYKIPNARLTKPFAMKDLVATVESLDGHAPA